MGLCNIPYELIRKYPQKLLAMFMSTTEYNTTSGHTDSHITDGYDGYIDELEAIGQAATSIGSLSLVASPYPVWLRPVTDINILYGKNVLLESLEYYAYDPTLTGAAAQNPSVLTAIYDSKSTDDAYMQSFYRNGLIPNWQPNYCRPEFWIDGVNMMLGLSQSNFGNKSNKGDMSIGIPLGKCFDYYREFERITKIKANGQVAQKVDVSGTSYYQRYALLCFATFRFK